MGPRITVSLLVLMALSYCQSAAAAETLGSEMKAIVPNWCEINQVTWVWQDSLNYTKMVAEAFVEGIQDAVSLSQTVDTALNDLGLGLDALSATLIDFIQFWIEDDIIANLITVLIEMEAEIIVSVVTGNAVCESLLNQVNLIINQLVAHDVCCILCDATFWETVTQVACDILYGMSLFVDQAGDKVSVVTIEDLRAILTNIIQGFENMIVAAVIKSPGNSSEESKVVRKAVASWTQNVLDAGFSPKTVDLLEQLLSYLTYGTEIIEIQIQSSKEALMNWVLQSTCSMTGTSQVLVSVFTPILEHFPSPKATCEDFDDMIPVCASHKIPAKPLSLSVSQQEDVLSSVLSRVYQTKDEL